MKMNPKEERAASQPQKLPGPGVFQAERTDEQSGKMQTVMSVRKKWRRGG